jgi:predicted amidohydrolase
MPGQVGTLAVDVWGDAVIFKLREGEFQLIHAHGEAKIGTQISSTIIAGNRS